MIPNKMSVGLKFKYVVFDNYSEARAKALKELGFKSMPFILDYDDEVEFENDIRKYEKLYEQYHCVNYSKVIVIGVSKKGGSVIEVEDDAGNVFKFGYICGRYRMFGTKDTYLDEEDE